MGVWVQTERWGPGEQEDSSLVAWSLRAHVFYILRTQLFSTCNSSSVCLECTSFISFVLTLTSSYSLLYDTWTWGARILLEMLPYVYMGLGSTCLKFELLQFSSMFSVCCKEIFPWWVVSTTIIFGYKDRYLGCSLAVCLLVKGQL